MKTLSVNTDMQAKFEAIAKKFFGNALNAAEQGDMEEDFCTCFDFMPSEAYEDACQRAKRERLKAEAYKDVMMTLMQYVTVWADDSRAISESAVAANAYEDIFQAAIERFEQLEQDLEALAPSQNAYE
jgi:hypothetical protein